jgi:hypothetical protein
MGQEMNVMVQPPIEPAELARMKAAVEPVLESFVKDNPTGKGLIEEARRLAK